MNVDRSTLPRVLIISVNPFSKTANNGKTYASFFQGYPADRLAQLYFHRELPTSDVCNNYYRISDEESMRFSLRQTSRLGGQVGPATTAEQLIPPRATRALASSTAVRLLRAQFLATLLPRGYSSVESWLLDFRPQLIFFSGGNATYLYPWARKISSRFAAPLLTYVTDDYILPSKHGGPLARLSRWHVRRHFLQLCRESARVLTIGNKMSAVYRQYFGIDSTPLMNLVDIPASTAHPADAGSKRPVHLVYAGGLHLNRWDTLARIGSTLDELASRGLHAELHIYTASLMDKRIAASFDRYRSIHVHGSVGSDELANVYCGADLLVHVESFSAADREATRLSLSTKLPEYLAAGRAIMAVGPQDLASIEYLDDSGAAFMATSVDPASLDAALTSAVGDPQLRAQKAAKAREVASLNHDAQRVRPRLWHLFAALVRGSSPGPDTGDR